MTYTSKPQKKWPSQQFEINLSTFWFVVSKTARKIMQGIVGIFPKSHVWTPWKLICKENVLLGNATGNPYGSGTTSSTVRELNLVSSWVSASDDDFSSSLSIFLVPLPFSAVPRAECNQLVDTDPLVYIIVITRSTIDICMSTFRGPPYPPVVLLSAGAP